MTAVLFYEQDRPNFTESCGSSLARSRSWHVGFFYL